MPRLRCGFSMQACGTFARALLLCSSLNSAPAVFAARDAQDHNLREACRTQVAGRYLVFYDAREKGQQMSRHLSRKVSELAAALGQAQAELAAVQQEMAAAPFDPDQNAKRLAVQEKEKVLREALATQQELQTKAAAAAVDAQAELTAFTARLIKVFRVEELKGSGVGYKFQIVYQGSCPPYRFSCPLSREEALALKQMFDGENLPEVCRRYADFLQW